MHCEGNFHLSSSEFARSTDCPRICNTTRIFVTAKKQDTKTYGYTFTSFRPGAGSPRFHWADSVGERSQETHPSGIYNLYHPYVLAAKSTHRSILWRFGKSVQEEHAVHT